MNAMGCVTSKTMTQGGIRGRASAAGLVCLTALIPIRFIIITIISIFIIVFVVVVVVVLHLLSNPYESISLSNNLKIVYCLSCRFVLSYCIILYESFYHIKLHGISSYYNAWRYISSLY